MAHNILRFATTVFNRPQYITAEGLAPIAKYISQRLSNPDFEVYKGDVVKPQPAQMAGSIGTIPIAGSLTYKPVFSMSGTTGSSYEGLIEQTQELIAKGAQTIIYEVSSNGGEALHCMSTANELRQLLDEAKVKSIAYVDQGAASAAYALSCVMDEIVIHPSAKAGSIGCVVCLLSDAQALEKEGYKRIVITDTPGKSPYAEDGSFTQKFLDTLQDDVVRLGTEFREHVSKYTGISMQTLAELDAGNFDAKKSLELGLVNSVMTHREFIKYVDENFN